MAKSFNMRGFMNQRKTRECFRNVVFWCASLILISFLIPPAQAASKDLTIAAAADLNFAFKELIADFEKQTGGHVLLTLGSSGTFYAQITNGAPYDLYFSADIGYPKKLIEAGLGLPDSLYQYAIGRIVLWTPKDSPLDVTKGMATCADPAVRKMSIANPKHAPYGRAAVSALEHYQMYDLVKDKLVFGENVAQAAQFVYSGAADIGVIALSLALAPAVQQTGTYWLIPADAHPAIEQGAVIVKSSQNIDEAKKFLEFLKTAPARSVMKRYGFVVPGGDLQP